MQTGLALAHTAGEEGAEAVHAGASSAATTSSIVVTTFGDTSNGSGACIGSALCTLRDAITLANSQAASHSAVDITFASGLLAGNAMTLDSPLPVLSGKPGTINITAAGAGASGLEADASGIIFTVESGVTASIADLAMNGLGYTGWVTSSGTLTLNDDQFSNSPSTCVVNSGTLTVINSTFKQCDGSNGGGIYNTGTATVTGSLFTGAYVNPTGGGINSVGGSLTVTNSTFSGNTADFGVAIYASGKLTVTNSTFDNNLAETGGGAILVDQGGKATITNSIFSNNNLAIADDGGTVNASYNVFYNDVYEGAEDDCDSCTSNIDSLDANPLLAAVGGYGGPTSTMLPLPGSPAICAGLVADDASLSTDARGFPRTTAYGTAKCIDAGAVQTGYSAVRFTNIPSAGYYRTIVGTSVSPGVIVSVTENAQIVGGVPVTLAFAGTGTATGLGPVKTVAATGATFSSVQVTASGSNDTLGVTLPITAKTSKVQPAALSATANLEVTAAPVSVTVATSPTGRTFTVDGASYTSAQTLTWTVGTTHTLVTTSPQIAGAREYLFANWGSGATALTRTVTASVGTTSYTATFSTQATPVGLPTFSPAAGTYNASQSVGILDSTAGATLCYTIDGSTPTASNGGCTHGSALNATAKISVTKTGTVIHAIGTLANYTNSAVVSATYILQAATPVFTPPAGNYASTQSVQIASTTPGAVIYYTTNGTAPTTASPRYTGTIHVSPPETVEAIAVVTGFATSAVTKAIYVLAAPTAKPTISPAGGTFSAPEDVVLTDPSKSAVIYYTVDGSAPTAASTRYTGAIVLKQTATVNAVAVTPGSALSAVVTAKFTIK